MGMHSSSVALFAIYRNPLSIVLPEERMPVRAMLLPCSGHPIAAIYPLPSLEMPFEYARFAMTGADCATLRHLRALGMA